MPKKQRLNIQKQEKFNEVQYNNRKASKGKVKVSNEELRQGLKTYSDFLTGKHKYSVLFDDRDHTWIAMPDDHPIKPGEIIQYVGSPGISSSIGPFVQELALHIDRIARFFIIKCEVMPNKHDVLVGVEIVMGDPTAQEQPVADFYLVGGLTDYSGEGGQAHKDLFSVISFIYLTCGVGVVNVNINPAEFETIDRLVNEAQTENLEGYQD